ncbi:hypothetical protein Arad_12039 (plasmid) [Rhizobium rhizogenes K84]|uniref:Uncharacterized protein n=1 Tax=Rhizobium rhizogenes (strain K84 / ATCC BAA-868) TaxID=311403 RepID=B9JPQ1_RHIR8|nr:hypothetical protein Arad_12039 [Rhizobium rhizogenes K84]
MPSRSGRPYGDCRTSQSAVRPPIGHRQFSYTENCYPANHIIHFYHYISTTYITYESDHTAIISDSISSDDRSRTPKTEHSGKSA